MLFKNVVSFVFYLDKTGSDAGERERGRARSGKIQEPGF